VCPARRDCPLGARVLIAFIGLVISEGMPLVPVPESVKRAGGRELKEFKKGRLVFDQGACEACHRIGDQGNAGPGPSLTHVGSKLSMRHIEHALVDPSAPMPAFTNLPRAKFHALVKFLSLLR
jgi:menaquinol-cytochrome c reductase cytochrome b/c subunit